MRPGWFTIKKKGKMHFVPYPVASTWAMALCGRRGIVDGDGMPPTAARESMCCRQCWENLAQDGGPVAGVTENDLAHPAVSIEWSRRAFLLSGLALRKSVYAGGPVDEPPGPPEPDHQGSADSGCPCFECAARRAAEG